MRKRIGIALSGAGVAAVLGLLLLWGGIAAEPVSAMERMAENIRKAKSFRAVMIVEGQSTPQPGEPPVKHKMTGTIYWLALGPSRVDMGGRAPNDEGGQTMEAAVTKIDLPGESPEIVQEIIIDHKAKTVRKFELPSGRPGADIVHMGAKSFIFVDVIE